MFKIHFGGKRDYGKSIYAKTRAPYNIKTFFFTFYLQPYGCHEILKAVENDLFTPLMANRCCSLHTFSLSIINY